ncbi:hypothetical protein NQD34_000131 [Periophthalmus magnuspinnatus]|uniref:uncharacterized protein si:ch211-243a20.4 n=1 Tax=Periophthalmus magnuspinnatus TaxID=409849 RepID=UPI0022C0E200|nr:uncharacterized protein si:ch211-243a20.4 [Periophthalmus magnuspinnatus]KAJ0033024.1 hypothetical protein NQD34_000131 [Periophthalmus magnuspinnatus]
MCDHGKTMACLSKGPTFGYLILLTWTLFLFSSTSGQKMELRILNRVCVALRGQSVTVSSVLKKPNNLTTNDNFLRCYDPLQKLIYIKYLFIIEGSGIKHDFPVENVNISGNYHCQYESAQAYWFLRVRDSGYKEVGDYTDIIVASVIMSLLLVFSVAGSVYVFRGNWFLKECCKTQNNEGNNERQKERRDTANTEPAQSASVYASLGTRQTSVYDVLEHSAPASADGHRDQTKAQTPKKREAQKTVRDAPQNPEEGIFEGVYENF